MIGSPGCTPNSTLLTTCDAAAGQREPDRRARGHDDHRFAHDQADDIESAARRGRCGCRSPSSAAPRRTPQCRTGRRRRAAGRPPPPPPVSAANARGSPIVSAICWRSVFRFSNGSSGSTSTDGGADGGRERERLPSGAHFDDDAPHRSLGMRHEERGRQRIVQALIGGIAHDANDLDRPASDAALDSLKIPADRTRIAEHLARHLLVDHANPQSQSVHQRCSDFVPRRAECPSSRRNSSARPDRRRFAGALLRPAARRYRRRSCRQPAPSSASPTALLEHASIADTRRSYRSSACGVPRVWRDSEHEQVVGVEPHVDLRKVVERPREQTRAGQQA